MKHTILLFVLLLLVPVLAFADGIRVSARDTEINRDRDRNVTNILVLLQEEDRTQMMTVASLNTKTGKAVMVQLDPELMVDIPEVGEVALSQVYALGDKKSKGFLAMRTVNRLLKLNLTNYVVVSMDAIPSLVDAVDGVWITPTEEEDLALGLDLDTWALDGQDTLAYIRLKLPGDAERNRAYEVMMQILRQVAEQDIMGMMGAGGKLLEAMDTNISISNAISLGRSLQGKSNKDEHHIDLFLPQAEAIIETSPLRADADKMEQKLTEVIYE